MLCMFFQEKSDNMNEKESQVGERGRKKEIYHSAMNYGSASGLWSFVALSLVTTTGDIHPLWEFHMCALLQRHVHTDQRHICISHQSSWVYSNDLRKRDGKQGGQKITALHTVTKAVLQKPSRVRWVNTPCTIGGVKLAVCVCVYVWGGAYLCPQQQRGTIYTPKLHSTQLAS